MGVYFELFLACNLKKDTPEQVIDILNYLIKKPEYDYKIRGYEPIAVPEHPFFEPDNRWQSLLVLDIYDGETFARLTKEEGDEYHKFTVRATMKYGEPVMRLFLHWLAPYSNTQEFVGYIRDDVSPFIQLICFENGSAFSTQVELYRDRGQPPSNRIQITVD